MSFQDLENKVIFSLKNGTEKPAIKAVGVKFFPKGSDIPKEKDSNAEDISTPWCGAVKLASDGDFIVITKKNIGCPAAAIALGLVDPDDPEPLEGSRKYTSLMKDAASPKDFTDGYVYACRASGHMEFALFGQEDCGRYKTLGASLKAVSGMTGIGKEAMDAVAAFPSSCTDYEPDVVVMGVTPKQAMRMVQGYAFMNGERVEFNTIGIRGVCADVTAYPFLEQKMNASFFCLGARALGGWEEDRLALGMPYHDFKIMAEGIDESQNGFPYKLFP
ncbi:MAG: DUF169 domain-containing protein [Candidatus Electrothrix sp. YB6]